uniref:Uncharacterized protein n=1 Tax=Gopherus evgoodei TaxID=1825980 RepID=A0A8C4VCE8_9SAUR
MHRRSRSHVSAPGDPLPQGISWKMKGKKSQKETSAELHGLQDIVDSQGFDGTVNSKLPRDQPPIKICKKCSKLRWKRPAGSAGADLPTRSHGIPKRWTPGDSSEWFHPHRPTPRGHLTNQGCSRVG